MPSLNLDLNYFDHPKVKRLIGLLGKGADILPIRLWCETGKHHAETGVLKNLTIGEIESMIGWWGRPGEAIEALVKVRLLDSTEDGFKVHDWTDHARHIWTFHVRAKSGAKARMEKILLEAQLQAPLQAQLQAELKHETSKSLAVQGSEVKATTPAAPGWCQELAAEIARHVQSELGKNTGPRKVAQWATAIDRLTRTSKLAPPPDRAEIEGVIRWGLQDRGRGDGSWPGWALQIQSAPDADKFVKIRKSMREERERKVAGKPPKIESTTQVRGYDIVPIWYVWIGDTRHGPYDDPEEARRVARGAA